MSSYTPPCSLVKADAAAAQVTRLSTTKYNYATINLVS
jgi:hypothetical protein